MNRVVNQWEVRTANNNGRVVFRYFADCVTGRANTMWIAAVNELAKDDAARTFESWQVCTRFYIEKMQNMSYIGDAVCGKILRWKHPVTVSFINHVDRIYELLRYIKESYLRCDTDMDVPNKRVIMNALYRMECAPIRKKYAKTRKRPEGPIDNFKSEMSTLEDADRGSVTSPRRFGQLCQTRG